MNATIPPNLIPEGARRRQQKAHGPLTRGPLLNALRNAAGAQREVRRIDLDVPGAFEGKMRVRYHGLSLDDLERYGELLENKQTQNVSMMVDMMARCCDTVLGYDDAEHDWIELCDDDGPVGLDHRLAVLLDLPAPAAGAEISSYELIVALFMPDGNAFPFGQHAGELVDWLGAKKGLDPERSSAETGSSLSAVPPLSDSLPT